MATAEILNTAVIGPGLSVSLKASKTDSAKCKHVQMKFNPDIHLAFHEPESVITMKEMGYDESSVVSPMAVSQPFRLFSEEAVDTFRTEFFAKQVLKNRGYNGNLAECQLRGYASKYAPFTFDAWRHPETLAIVSKIAQVDLVPQMDYEIGHVNINIRPEEETRVELDTLQGGTKSFADDESIASQPGCDVKPAVDWHRDSFPFVCVTMLSDCTNMVGGETVVRKVDGSMIKVRGPQRGCAVMMQGRYITHPGLRALGGQERITMVTSFRPKSPHIRDDSVLTTVRGVSNLSELYYEYSLYRLEMLEKRVRWQFKRMREAHRAQKRTDTQQIKSFLDEQERFIKHTNAELVPEQDVVVGEQPDLDIPNEMAQEEKALVPKRLILGP